MFQIIRGFVSVLGIPSNSYQVLFIFKGLLMSAMRLSSLGFRGVLSRPHFLEEHPALGWRLKFEKREAVGWRGGGGGTVRA